MLLLDLTHTSHTRARTGIQRVARSLAHHLGSRAIPVTRDPFLRAWRPLENWERGNLQESPGSEDRRSQWPAGVRWRGRLDRILGRARMRALSGTFDGWIEPELFVPKVAQDFPRAFAHVRGPRVALFLDAIALKLPELTPPATVARFPAYMKELLLFDGIAAISADSRDALLSYWQWLGVSDLPPVIALPLGVDLPPQHANANASAQTTRPVVLSVGSLEGRKNHIALLTACEELWTQGEKFELHLIGHLDPKTGQTVFDRIRALQAAGKPLRYNGPATDHAVDEAYAQCAFTVYPSRAEGFGLPVIESLARGKPCVCSGDGALGEISRQGGCLPLSNVEPAAIAAAIRQLLRSPDDLAKLSREAGRRQFKTWAEYANELTSWLATLRRRP